MYLGAIDYVLDVKHTVGDETGWQRFGGMVKRTVSRSIRAAARMT
ncbi:hypothetical protein AB4Y40_20835 [Paraburkholderia sp. EG287B]